MKSFKHLLFVAGVCTLVLLSNATVSATGQLPGIYVVDRLVADVFTHIEGMATTDKIFNLPDKGNPLDLITEELKLRNYSELHLFLLTKPGSMIFDELNILAENVTEYASQFSEWRKYLAPGAKIIIHSDSLTSVPDGITLVERISELTGVTVVVQN